MEKPFYINTAIPYANAKPHIGHAIEVIYADVLARYWRQQRREVFFLTGTDEHGQKMAKAAKNAGQQPQAFADEITLRFQALKEVLNLSTDDFIRTTSPNHIVGAQAFWSKCQAAGDIYKKTYQGLYCIGCESFKTEKDLVDGKCPDHKTVPEMVEEENYFFRLSNYTEKLLAWYESHPDFVYPKTKFNEIKQLVKEEGLQDVSISRSSAVLTWGIPVPGDPSQVMYVWFDGLTNYLTGIGYHGEQIGEWTKWWPNDVLMVGKEINRFHSALWPAMLMSAGIAITKQVAVHGWITVDGQKMSKTVGNVLDPVELVKKYGIEPLRYYLLREIPFERDGDFSHRRFAERYSADLANDLGNLLSRTTTMIEKYLDGKLDTDSVPPTEMMKIDIQAQLKVVFGKIEGLQFDQALESIWQLLRAGNALIDQEKPWVLAKDNPDRLKQVLNQLVDYLNTAATGLESMLPATAAKIHQTLAAQKIIKAEPLFPRLEEKQI